jgi:glutaredoxin 2
MTMTLSEIQGVVSLFLGVAGFSSGVILWYRGAIEKRYASERDFAHLRRNQEQLIANLAQMDEAIDRLLSTTEAMGHLVHSNNQVINQIDRSILELKVQINWTNRETTQNSQREPS